MKPILVLLLLSLAPLPLSGAEPRDPFPADYQAHPCAPSDLCGSVSRGEILNFAMTFRGFDIDPAWLRAHWTDLQQALGPLCAKIATCIATPGNSEVFCTDLMREEFVRTADRFDRTSHDWHQWTMSALTYYLGHFRNFRLRHQEAQACASSMPAQGDRTLDVWLEPEIIGPDYEGTLRIFALDAETRVPVMGLVTVDGQEGVAKAQDSPDGKPLTVYPLDWPVTFNRVPNGDGFRDVVAPTITVKAAGYQTVTIPMPVEVPKMIVEMTPSPSALKTGRNSITITARDVATGKPVEARVMAGEYVVGDTNMPLVLELRKGEKRPTIWVTSLFDRYSDAVVVRGD
jgi:hypothetical protein